MPKLERPTCQQVLADEGKSCSVATKKGLGEAERTWVWSATVGAYVIAGDALNEILKGALVSCLLALAHESGHDSSRGEPRLKLRGPVLLLGS
ncbi:hypothetical protein RRF57_004850 [Xylaria bambusicola]|uniref:Uncharacterized protein n=1 Tax=Xylaria bambusicola TaxID=326684 RepID=A0AAN7Z8Y1_9PEZI